MSTETFFSKFKEPSLSGRYIPLDAIIPLVSSQSKLLTTILEGHSEEGQEIHSLTLGTGTFKILIWSQMHGNETTTTKSIFDLVNFLNSKGSFQEVILKNCTIKVIPILNPDGALRYTRENANKVDLNRDAQDKSQKETQVLFTVFDDFKPDLCLNMHDQRSIFSVGNTEKSAVISFLAPSADESKSITNSRAYAMQLISSMNQKLQALIPNHIGRYDDAFNINCVGDSFQSLGVPTILFEAGHYPGDYQREKTREYIFNSLLHLLELVSSTNILLPEIKHYTTIPENKKLFFDVIIRNAKISNVSELVDIAIQFEEKLLDERIQFVPKVQKIGDLSAFFAHKNLQANGKSVYFNNKSKIENHQTINDLSIENEKISMI
ncbi:MAG: M14 metallopeptidase family protein [Flavobacteriaceae bacterium]